MKAFMVKGVHDSGKTTLVENLIRTLCARGYTVGSLKDIHSSEYRMDRPGTDTDRHRHAGASLVAALGPSEAALLMDGKQKAERLIGFFDQDILIIEGQPEGISCPNLVTGITREDWDFRMDERTLGFTGILGASGGEYRGLRVYDPVADIQDIADLAQREGMDMTGQDARERELKLTFDGEEVPMVPFVEKIIKASLLGILGELRGYTDDVKIRIEL